jgi:predicted transcriptional regulator
MTAIKGTRLRCKDKDRVKGQFEQLPDVLMDYVRYGLIKPNDIHTYFLLMKYDNKDKGGYAYPTIGQLQIDHGGVSDNTIRQSLKRLENSGLIRIEKSQKFTNKNIYFVYLPHSKEEFIKLLPESVKENYDERESKIIGRAASEKERLNHYLQQKKQNNVL